MDSTVQVYRRIVSSLIAALLVIGLTSCASTPGVTDVAPHSAVSRDDALALAKHVAATVGGRVYVIAPSGSMLPTLDEGSIVAIEKVALDRLKKGDIIVYRNSAGLAVIHRLYEQHGDRWFVLGDNNASIDRESVSADNLLGRVCAIFYTATDRRSASIQPTAMASRQ